MNPRGKTLLADLVTLRSELSRSKKMNKRMNDIQGDYIYSLIYLFIFFFRKF